MDIGDTFLLVDKSIDEHLWVVISLPGESPDNVVIVNLTSWDRLKDHSCILEVGDHEWIKHKTCVRYDAAKCVSESKLDALVASGHLVPREAASNAMIDKLLRGASMAREDMPNKCRRVLVDQILMD